MLFRRIIPAMAATLGAYLGLSCWPGWSCARTTPWRSTPQREPVQRPSTPDSPWILKTWTTGNTHWWRYIPVSRFWPMQFIESGWLLVLAIALGAATVWLVRRRAA